MLKNVQDLPSKEAEGLKRRFFDKKESAGPSAFAFSGRCLVISYVILCNLVACGLPCRA